MFVPFYFASSTTVMKSFVELEIEQKRGAFRLLVFSMFVSNSIQIKSSMFATVIEIPSMEIYCINLNNVVMLVQ